MANVKIAKKNKIFCHDCQKEIEIEEKKIKNGFRLVYDNRGEKITVFKCKDCYQRSPELRNYQTCEVYSRIVGYLRPVQQWNLGKKEEFKRRRKYRKFKEERLTTLSREKIPNKRW